MRLVLTGGGTGGHVYPALEIGLAGRERGWDVRYLGSQRGQEGAVCAKNLFWFKGFPSEPVVKPASIKGLRAIFNLVRSTGMARQELSLFRPDVIFATGGYSSAPVVRAARGLKLPYVIHEQNSSPGRSNLMWAAQAARVCTVFRSAEKHFAGCRVVRTGLPLRRAIRQAASGTLPIDSPWGVGRSTILVMGGSQGAKALNDIALSTAVRMAKAGVQWVHLTGVNHFESALHARNSMPIDGDYDIKAFVEADGMAQAFASCTVAVCRSGAGTIAELAAFRKPAIFVPFPAAFGNHQELNALEIAEAGGGDLYSQSQLDPAGLEGRILSWVHEPDRVVRAQAALADWDIVDSVDRIIAELISVKENQA